jgi:signal peptidase I
VTLDAPPHRRQTRGRLATPVAGHQAGPVPPTGRPLVTGEGETATSSEPGEGSPASATSDAPPKAAAPGGAPGADPKAATTGGRRRSFWRELPVLIVVALVIALVIKTFVVQAFYIPSGSMQNTLEIGDKVLVNKLDFHLRPIHPGDIIVFDGVGSWNATAVSAAAGNPAARVYDATLRPLLRSIGGLFGTAPGQTDYIKRVIGVPGDHVACCNAQGLVTVNGVPLQEQDYLFPGNTPGVAPLGESGHFSLTVPAGRLWVLGDHRSISDDSRGHVVDPGDGTIPESQVIGRAFLLVWPPSRWQVLRIPATFQQRGIVAGAAAPPAPGLSSSGLSSSGASLATADGPLASGSPYLPLAAGFAGAVPLTFLRRRLRRRPARRGPRRRSRPSPDVPGSDAAS